MAKAEWLASLLYAELQRLEEDKEGKALSELDGSLRLEHVVASQSINLAQATRGLGRRSSRTGGSGSCPRYAPGPHH